MTEHTRLRARLPGISRYLALVAASGSALTAVLRLLDAPTAIFLPSVSASCAILLCGLALALPPGSKRLTQASTVLASGALFIALGALLYYAWMGSYPAPYQRFILAPITGVVILLVASAILALQHTRGATLAQGLAAMALAICLLALAGYSKGTEALAQLGTALPMTMSAALMLGLTSISALGARPESGPMAVATSPTPAGTVARRLFLPLVILPLLFSFLFQQLQQWGLYSASTRQALFLSATLFTVAALVWWHILTLYRADSRRQRLESEAQQSSEQLAMLVQSITDYAIFSMDPQGRVTSWNPGAQRIKGYSPDEIMGRPYSQFFPQAEVKAGTPQRLLNRARDTGRVTTEGWRIRKDGSRFYARATLSRISDSYGHLLGFAKVTQDFSFHKRAEEERTQLQSILNTVMDAILVTDDKGMIETFNPAAERVFGYSKREILHQNVSLLLPEAQSRQPESLAEVTGEALKDRLVGPAHEMQGRRKDGSQFPAELTLSEMTVDGRRKFTGIVRDISRRKAAENRIKQSEMRLSLALEAGNIGVWDVDVPTGKMTISGPIYETLAATAPGETDVATRVALIHPDDQEAIGERMRKLMGGEEDVSELEYRVRTREGSWYWVRSRGLVSSRDNKGLPLHIHGATIDIHQRKITEEELRKSTLDLEIALKDANFHLWHFHLQEHRVEDLDYLIESLGYSRTSQTSDPGFWLSILHPEDQEKLSSLSLWPLPEELTGDGIELRLGKKGGDWRWMVVRARVAETDLAGTPTVIAGTCIDITDRKRAEQRLLRAAQRDSLTGLPNRALTYALGDKLLESAPRHDTQCAILFVDLDRFKPINDTYGHAAGDVVLRQVALRLRSCVRSEDVVGRLGGDEFLVVLSQMQGPENVMHIAENCLAAVARPCFYRDLELQVSPSIGISIYPDDGHDMTLLVKQADTAMYHAKERGRNQFQFFTPKIDRHAKSLLALETRLRRAIEENAFQLHYQPVVDTDSRRIIAVEALLRWPSEAISPDSFIPIAESSGLILPLGEWVLQEACRQHQEWARKGIRDLRMAVNVSPVQFRQQRLEEQVSRAITETGMDPAHLQLEITENTFMHNLDSVVKTLHLLRSAGLNIALDDFGKSYSSLNYLKRLPLDTVKVDKDFVHELQTDKVNLAITEAIINLGDSLGLEVIVEGIESQDVLELLRTKRCTHMQGYFLGKPLPASDFEKWFQRSTSRTAYWH